MATHTTRTPNIYFKRAVQLNKEERATSLAYSVMDYPRFTRRSVDYLDVHGEKPTDIICLEIGWYAKKNPIIIIFHSYNWMMLREL